MQDRVDAIANIYGIQVNDTIAGIVSVADQISFFDEERRALAYTEILNPVEYMDVDFVALQAIPLIDAYYTHNTIRITLGKYKLR